MKQRDNPNSDSCGKLKDHTLFIMSDRVDALESTCRVKRKLQRCRGIWNVQHGVLVEIGMKREEVPGVELFIGMRREEVPRVELYIGMRGEEVPRVELIVHGPAEGNADKI